MEACCPFFVETVIQRAVDDGVEAAVIPAEIGGVGDFKGDGDASLGGASTRLFDRGRRAVESRHEVSAGCQIDGVVAEAAA